MSETRDYSKCAGGCGKPHDGLAPSWNLFGGRAPDPSETKSRFCGNCYDAYVRMVR